MTLIDSYMSVYFSSWLQGSESNHGLKYPLHLNSSQTAVKRAKANAQPWLFFLIGWVFEGEITEWRTTVWSDSFFSSCYVLERVRARVCNADKIAPEEFHKSTGSPELDD